MKLSVKKIGGQKYLYVHDGIYISKNNQIEKYQSLGRAESIINTPEKLESFKKKIEEIEIHERAKYWKEKIQNDEAFKYQGIEKLEGLRTKLYKGKQNLGPVGKHAMDTAFIIDFIYNSNKIEGSRLAHRRVTEMVKEGTGKGKNNEVTNTIKAIEFFNNEPSIFTLRKLKKGQAILLNHEINNQGFRNEPFVVGNSPVANHKEIKEKLEDLFEWYKREEDNMYPLELAFIFHYRFERIHPFPDGNGRTGRILMNMILKKHKYHPIIVWNSRRQAYFSSFEKAMEGNIEDFLRFMTDEYIKTYETYIKKLEPANSFDDQLKHFLVPSE